MTTIRHLVFDIGGVLIHFDPEIPYRRIIPDAARRRWFLENVCCHSWNLEQDRGRSWHDGERLLIERFPDAEAEIRAYRPNWHEMVPYAYHDSVAIMETLIETGKDVTLLTNFAADTFEEACLRYPFLAKVRAATVSGRIGSIKPEAQIFAHHAATCGLDPAAILFIDDNEANVRAAQSHGWNAIAFKNAEALKADLERFGAVL